MEDKLNEILTELKEIKSDLAQVIKNQNDFEVASREYWSSNSGELTFMMDRVQSINHSTEVIESDMSTMRSEMTAIRSDMNTVRLENRGMRTEIKRISEHVLRPE